MKQDDVFPAAVCDECPMKCGPGRTYWNGEFEKVVGKVDAIFVDESNFFVQK